jgi:hypothetical protein
MVDHGIRVPDECRIRSANDPRNSRIIRRQLLEAIHAYLCAHPEARLTATAPALENNRQS